MSMLVQSVEAFVNKAIVTSPVILPIRIQERLFLMII